MGFQSSGYQAGNAFQRAAGLVSVAPFAFTVTTGQVFTQTLNYQDVIYCPPPIAAASNLTTTLEWQQPLSVAVPIPRPFPDGRQPFVPKAAVLDNTVTPDNWLIRWDLPPRYLIGLPGGQPFVPKAAVIENTITAAWPLTFGEKARPLPLTAPLGGQPFVPKEAVLDNTTNRVWPLTQGEIARPIIRPAPVGGQPFVPRAAVIDNTVTPDNWLIRWDLPPRYLLGLPGGQPFIPEAATRENTTNTVWPLSFGDLARPVPYTAPSGYWAFGYPYVSQSNLTTTLEWQQPLSKSVPIPSPSAPLGGLPFVPKEATRENTTNRVWPLAFGELARQQPKPAPSGGQPFVAKAAVLENTVTPDKWLQRFQGPPRYWPSKTQVVYQVEPPFVVNNTITGIPWFQALGVPPRYTPAQSNVTWPAQFVAVAVDYCAFQPDAFQRPFSDPFGVFAAFQTCPEPPIPPVVIPKPMRAEISVKSGSAPDKITGGKAKTSVTGGKGRGSTEHDP